MTKEELVAFLSDMIDALTWQRVGLLCALGVVTVSLLVAFENRASIFNQVFGHESLKEQVIVWEVSNDSKDELKNLTKQTFVGGVLLSEIELKKNRRITKYWHVEDAKLKQSITSLLSTLLPQAVFDTDRKNNEQMLLVLNNQFRCVPTIDTPLAKLLPDMPKILPYVCNLAVPPYVGDFAGVITVALKREPTAEEINSLKIEVTRISIELYLRDIQRRNALGPK
jgi:hypothetical protein